MFDNMVLTLSKAFWDTDLVASRLTLSASSFFWAVMLLWPGSSFDRDVYYQMGNILSENMWGFIFLATSAIQFMIIAKGDYCSALSRIFAGFSAALWTYIVLSMLISVYPPPAAIGGEIALSLSALWIWARPYFLASGYRYVRQNN